jgi:hypothetical protein
VNRHLGLTLLTSAFMVAVIAAQDDPSRANKEGPAEKKVDPKKNADDLPPVKELEKKDSGRPQGGGGGDDPERIKKIIDRLHKNMDSSEERLNKKDPGEDTRTIQGDIIKDLDELIKQQNQGGGGGGGGASSSSAGSKGSKGSSGNSGGSSSGSGASGNGGQSKGGQGSQAKKGNQGGDAKKGDPSTANNDKKKDGPDKLGKGGQTAKGDPGKEGKEGKEGKGGGGMGGNANDKKSTLADLEKYKEIWGHLPLSKRQEMDAYAKERFLSKYEEILRQYYRTISEQGRRKDGE